MKFIYTPYTPTPLIIHPSEMEEGEEGIVVQWFSKVYPQVGKKITRVGNYLFMGNSELAYSHVHKAPSHLYKVKVYR